MEGLAFYRQDFVRLEREVADVQPAWIRQIRQAAFTKFMENGFPTCSDEGWQHSDVTPLAKISFDTANSKVAALTMDDLVEATFAPVGGSQLVFLNGHFSRELSVVRPLPSGVTIGSLAALLETSPEHVEPRLARYADCTDQAFVALNTAFMQDGGFAYIPRHTIVEEPLHLVFASTAQDKPFITYPRNLIVLGEKSQATVVESYIAIRGGVYFTNAVTEVVLDKDAHVNHCALQHESSEAFHFMNLAVHQARGSRLSSTSISLGAGLARSEVRALLNAEAIECNLSGLYLANGRQHVDLQTMIDHAKPGSTSRQRYKGILDGKASGVFKGRILVRKDAQKTDAAQTNQNLLLSEDAVVHTTPQLEIFADDVKCKHGTAVGHLDSDALFYLRSRGLGEVAARNLMVYGFASEITNRIPVRALQVRVSEFLSRWISGSQPTAEAM